MNEKAHNFPSIEQIIIIILWLLSGFTYIIAISNSYRLFLSDWLGLTGLCLTTILVVFKSKYITTGLLFLLLLGSFNIISFVYFINIVITFGIDGLITLGVQPLSLILLFFLTYKRGDFIADKLRNFYKTPQTEKKASFERIKKSFKKKFELLSNEEIDSRLLDDLQLEAKQVLLELLEERKSDK